VQRQMLHILDLCNGDRAEAVRRLGVSRKTIDGKMQAWGEVALEWRTHRLLFDQKARRKPMFFEVSPFTDPVDHGEQARCVDRGQDAVPCAFVEVDSLAR